MKVKDGLVGISDTRLTSGRECMTAKKVTVRHGEKKQAFFLMTSGLRSVRDKALTYFQEVIDEQNPQYDKLYKLVNAFADQVKRVAGEDKKALTDNGFDFNLHALVAGQLENDKEPMLYLLFPEGNWVEVGEGSPYFIIGNTGHGKPLLDRVLRHDSTLEFALTRSIYAPEYVVWMLWGKQAQQYARTIATSSRSKKHLVLEAAHPSPQSAHSGFFGCRHFEKANIYLKEKTGVAVNW
jgi:putative proteasome-type protease